MIVRFIEATNGPLNWGKFMVARFEPGELAYVSKVTGTPLLRARGWAADHTWVMDLETCEGAAFALGGLARYDLEKHKVWVCPLFEPFLEWLYKQDTRDISLLPALVELDAPFALYGHRRSGLDPNSGASCIDESARRIKPGATKRTPARTPKARK